MSEIGLKKTELDTPFLWVDLDLLESNIIYLADYFEAAGVNWRPPIKGIKVPAIAHQAIASGAIGVTCAKVGEAEIMAAAEIQNILIANQIVGPIKIARLVNLQHHTDVKVAVDSEANVVELEAILATESATIIQRLWNYCNILRDDSVGVVGAHSCAAGGPDARQGKAGSNYSATVIPSDRKERSD